MDTMTMKMNQKAARENHFRQGGTCQQWSGNPRTFTDKKKDASKKACRGPQSYAD